MINLEERFVNILTPIFPGINTNGVFYIVILLVVFCLALHFSRHAIIAYIHEKIELTKRWGFKRGKYIALGVHFVITFAILAYLLIFVAFGFGLSIAITGGVLVGLLMFFCLVIVLYIFFMVFGTILGLNAFATL